MTAVPSQEDALLLSRALESPAARGDPDAVSRDEFAAIAAAEGLDRATAILYRRVASAPQNAAFLADARNTRAPTDFNADLIGIVPGAFHRERRNTGADGARVLTIARRLGLEAERLPVGNFSEVADSARVILDWLQRHRDRRVALVSLSKGSAEVKQALAAKEAQEAFRPVTAWINLSGIVQGTPLVDWLRHRPLRWWAVRMLLWWRGHGSRPLHDLRSVPGRPSDSWPALPPHLRIVHVYGFPCRRHLVHEWAPRAYDRLAPLGPNDGGGNLLADVSALPGIVCPVWGVDHYLDPDWDLLPALIGIVQAALTSRQPCQAKASDSSPSNPPASRSST